MKSAWPAEYLLSALHAIEGAFGRTRCSSPSQRYAPRTLDLDLLAVGSERADQATLTLPHPQLTARDFVLLPLADVTPGWRHPVSDESLASLIGALTSITAKPLGEPN